MMSDAHIIIGAAWCLIGYLCGAGAMVCLFWRRITRPADATVRALRMQIDDDAARRLRQQAIIDELTVEVVELYQSKDRLARRYVEAQANRTRGMVT
jgi:hypothetical protein